MQHTHFNLHGSNHVHFYLFPTYSTGTNFSASKFSADNPKKKALYIKRTTTSRDKQAISEGQLSKNAKQFYYQIEDLIVLRKAQNKEFHYFLKNSIEITVVNRIIFISAYSYTPLFSLSLDWNDTIKLLIQAYWWYYFQNFCQLWWIGSSEMYLSRWY